MKFLLLSFYCCIHKDFKVYVNLLRIMFDEQDSLKDNQISRREFVKLAGAGTLFLGLGAFGISNVLKNIREASAQGANATNATGASAAPPTNNLDIRPFRVNVPEAELTELRRRIKATRFPERETCVAAHCHARMARLRNRAIEDYRSPDQSHGTWRKRI
jgi:hypothetical protein